MMFRYFASLPPGCFGTTLDNLLPGHFATWMVCYVLPPGRFAPLDIVIPGCSTFCLNVSLTDVKRLLKTHLFKRLTLRY